MHTPSSIVLPQHKKRGPLFSILLRFLLAVFLIAVTAGITYAERDGYRDNTGTSKRITLLDSFYYATVSITTTGYGDITPVSKEARFLTTVILTPFRVMFLILLVGTTVEFLASASQHLVRLKLWRRHMHDHTIVCGYGTKGQSAVATLIAQGTRPEKIIIVDQSKNYVEKANSNGYAAMRGNATQSKILQEVAIEKAKSIIVAVDRDDTAVLVTLTARSLNASIHIAVGVREEENAPLLRQGGADTVLVSSGTTGRLLGLSTRSAETVALIEDLLDASDGMALQDRVAEAGDVGPLSKLQSNPDQILLALVRNGEVLRRHTYSDDLEIHDGDHLIYLKLS